MLDNPNWKPAPRKTKEEIPEVWRTILREAASIIEKHGWVQGSYGYVDRGFCALGSISIAEKEKTSGTYPTTDDGVKAVRHLEKHIKARYGAHCISVWNDSRKSKKTIIETMRAVADAG